MSDLVNLDQHIFPCSTVMNYYETDPALEISRNIRSLLFCNVPNCREGLGSDEEKGFLSGSDDDMDDQERFELKVTWAYIVLKSISYSPPPFFSQLSCIYEFFWGYFLLFFRGYFMFWRFFFGGGEGGYEKPLAFHIFFSYIPAS